MSLVYASGLFFSPFALALEDHSHRFDCGDRGEVLLSVSREPVKYFTANNVYSEISL